MQQERATVVIDQGKGVHLSAGTALSLSPPTAFDTKTNMAPKRKEAEAEPTADAPRRSGRTSAPNSSASSKVASKAKPAAPKPASKKAEPASKKPKVDTVEKEEKEAEKEDVQAEEKVEDASGGVGAVVKDVTLKNGARMEL